MAALKKSAKALLRPEQTARLKQIGLQQRGVEAFADPEVVAALKLSDQQKEAIRALQEETHQAVWAVYRSGTFRPEDWRKVETAWRTMKERLLQTLTAEQKTRWQDLTGQPFHGEVLPPIRKSA